jgi:SSS family solute:Na+ symporter
VYPELVKRVVPFWLIGFFAAVVMGAVLSTFNSVLNSAATLFSVDIYKQHLDPQVSENKLVRIGKTVSAVLALASIVVAPLVANAPAGLYQLLQQLNGIFFIPIASILLAGFFMKGVSAAGAKAALLVGLLFYILMTFVYTAHGVHFVHIWGIEFLLNVAVMYGVSRFFPPKQSFEMKDVGAVDLTPWRYTVPLSVLLCVVTVAVYLLLGTS